MASQRPVRVLVVFNSADLYGMERAVIQTFDSLRPEVEPLFLLSQALIRRSLPLRDELQARGLTHIFLSDRQDWVKLAKPRSLGHAWQVAKAFILSNVDVLRAAQSADVIYVPSRSYLYHSILGCLWHRLRGRRVVFEIHDALTKPSRSLRYLHWLISDVVTGSRYASLTCNEHAPYLASKSHVIMRTLERTAPVTNSLHKYEDLDNVLFIGQVTRAKGVDVLIEAFARLACRSDMVHLHIVGGCHDHHFGLEIDEMIDRLRLRERVTQWGFRRDARGFIAGATVFVQPTRPQLHAEAAPVAILEAMAAGLPAVVFRSGAFSEFVVHGQTGFVCQEDSADCLAGYLQELVGDARLRDRLGNAARTRFESHHSATEVRAAWLSLLRRDTRIHTFQSAVSQ